MDEFKPNSHKYRAAENEKKHFQKVVKGNVKTSNDSVDRIKSDLTSYVLHKVIIPGFKDILSHIIKDGSDIILYKSVGNARRNSRTKDTYTDYSRNRVIDITDYQAPQYSRPIYKRIVLETREDAEEVLDNLSNAIDEFGVVSISDLYEFVGVQSEYTDNEYGWTNISSAKAIPVSDGYLLKLPKAILI